VSYQFDDLAFQDDEVPLPGWRSSLIGGAKTHLQFDDLAVSSSKIAYERAIFSKVKLIQLNRQIQGAFFVLLMGLFLSI